MDLNVKQWRYHQQVQESSDSDHLPESAAKLPRLLDVQQQYQQQQAHPSPSGSSPPGPLPLFVPQPTTKLTHLSSLIPTDHSTPTTAPPRFPMMGSYFSVGQWQELELQALIFRHMLAGAAVPPQLLHLVKNSRLLNTSSPPPPPHPLLHHYYNNSHYHPSLQSGYWGRASLDPEPGRCRRTDGKKWRCSRDVVAGHKYCERHMHRGRNRSRKPVEIPTPSAAGGDGRGGGVPKINGGFAAAQPLSGATYFELAARSPSVDLFHLNQRPSESRTVNKSCLFDADNEASGDGKSSGQVLRHFFDDWPRSLQEHADNGGSNPGPITASSPCLSISTPSYPTSDFSLKLSTGNGEDHQAGNQELGGSVVVERGRLQANWAGGGWGTTTMGGGPLAEALRSSSSTSNSSPTSVLHQLPRISAAETSCISTSVQ